MPETDTQLPVPCTECQAGMLQMQFITYFTWLGEELITVPNFPAWVCDVCGRREYDEVAISWLTALLSPNAGKAPARRRRPLAPPRAPEASQPRPE